MGSQGYFGHSIGYFRVDARSWWTFLELSTPSFAVGFLLPWLIFGRSANRLFFFSSPRSPDTKCRTRRLQRPDSILRRRRQGIADRGFVNPRTADSRRPGGIRPRRDRSRPLRRVRIPYSRGRQAIASPSWGSHNSKKKNATATIAAISGSGRKISRIGLHLWIAPASFGKIKVELEKVRWGKKPTRQNTNIFILLVMVSPVFTVWPTSRPRSWLSTLIIFPKPISSVPLTQHH